MALDPHDQRLAWAPFGVIDTVLVLTGMIWFV